MTEDTKASRKGEVTAISVIIIGCLLVFLLIICVICLLAIMGPQIGNVFSQITFSLQTTPVTP